MGSARGSVHWGCGVGRGAREGACTGAATTPQPSTLRLILSNFLNAMPLWLPREIFWAEIYFSFLAPWRHKCFM